MLPLSEVKARSPSLPLICQYRFPARETPPRTKTEPSAPLFRRPVTLTWSGVGSDAHHYEVWRAFGAAYFTPDAGGERIAAAVSPAAQMSFTDTGAQAAQPGTQVFYLVRAVDAAGRPSPTYNRVGAVTFGLRGGEAR